jgi:hypothetical protein
MLHLAAEQRRQLQQRMDMVMDVAAAHLGGKTATEWIAKLSTARGKT